MRCDEIVTGGVYAGKNDRYIRRVDEVTHFGFGCDRTVIFSTYKHGVGFLDEPDYRQIIKFAAWAQRRLSNAEVVKLLEQS